MQLFQQFLKLFGHEAVIVVYLLATFQQGLGAFENFFAVGADLIENLRLPCSAICKARSKYQSYGYLLSCQAIFKLVSILKRPFFPISASICTFACAA
ncbi:MAG: hypothetical protein BA869_04675 [Desulfuromonadales bacterium C00003107]|nr:MAG: hypothetical protein BA869_04675 [Desulfuromonadales bacterium C00003107]